MTKRGRPKGSKNNNFSIIPMKDIKADIKEELFFARLLCFMIKSKKEFGLEDQDTSRIIRKVLCELK